MILLRQIVAVIGKDLLVEFRSLSRFTGIFFFAIAILMMVSFAAGSDTKTLQDIAGGTLWIGTLLASTRAFDQSYGVEMDNGALEGLVLWPVEPIALFYGKTLANSVVIIAVIAALFPLSLAMFDVTVRGSWLMMLGFLVLGCTGLAAPGTLFAAITNRARGASVLLPLLLFPLVVPTLMAAARGTTLLIEGDPMNGAPNWLSLLVIVNIVHWSLSGVLYGRIVEDA